MRRTDTLVLGAALMAAWSCVACGGQAGPVPTVPAAVDSSSAAPQSSPPAADSSMPTGADRSAAAAGTPASTGGAGLAPGDSTGGAGAAEPDRSLNDYRAIILGNRERFRACYDQAQKKNTALTGRFVLQFVVNPDGSVKSAATNDVQSQMHDPAMTTCAVSVLNSLKFPPSKKGKESTVNYPFDFHPKNPKPAAQP